MDLYQNARLTLRGREALVIRVVVEKVPKPPANGCSVIVPRGVLAVPKISCLHHRLLCM
jgi:hypothetical protein